MAREGIRYTAGMTSTDENADKWCPNCNQLVQPKDEFAGHGCLLLIAFWAGGAAILYWLGYTGSWGGKAGLISGLIILGALGTRFSKQICPICGTENLSTEARQVAGD